MQRFFILLVLAGLISLGSAGSAQEAPGVLPLVGSGEGVSSASTPTNEDGVLPQEAELQPNADSPASEKTTASSAAPSAVSSAASSDSSAPAEETKAEPAEPPTEEELKERLISSTPIPDKAKDALRQASSSMSYSFLQSYLKLPHHAYDGHSVLQHAMEKDRFSPPVNGHPCPDCGETVFNQNPNGPFPAWSYHYTKSQEQYSRFPIPLSIYAPAEKDMTLWQKLAHRVKVDHFNLAATIIFLLAILHTFLAPRFQSLAHYLEKRHKQKLRDEKFRILHPEQRVPVSFASTLCHFLGEVEVVFGLWIVPFFFVCQHYYSMDDFLRYIDHDTSFTEPLFVAVVMVVASSRPIYRLAENTLKFGASLGEGSPAAWWLSVLCIAPLLGSFITEPAAMTLAAILLSKKFYQLKPCPSLCYATIALLFVNVSVGGTLTHFAAPPIVMIAGKWNWDMAHMFTHFGWKAIVGIALSNIIYFLIFAKEFKRLAEVQRINSAYDGTVPTSWEDRQDVIPIWVYAVSILFLAWTVMFAHHPAIFIGGFMFFLGFTMATPQYQNAFSIKVPLLVAFFLAGLLIMGGVQGWWMQPVLQALSELGAETTMAIASILTAFNDNASVTFLSSTVPNLPEEIRYAIVAGAVTGGGLTVIANAPNPAGQAILGKFFKSGISAIRLFLWALLPTIIMFCMFNFIHIGE